MSRKPDTPLRTGFTTGACATAATRAAYMHLLEGIAPRTVQITLPRGQRPEFAIEAAAAAPATGPKVGTGTGTVIRAAIFLCP